MQHSQQTLLSAILLLLLSCARVDGAFVCVPVLQLPRGMPFIWEYQKIVRLACCYETVDQAGRVSKVHILLIHHNDAQCVKSHQQQTLCQQTTPMQL